MFKCHISFHFYFHFHRPCAVCVHGFARATEKNTDLIEFSLFCTRRSVYFVHTVGIALHFLCLNSSSCTCARARRYNLTVSFLIDRRPLEPSPKPFDSHFLFLIQCTARRFCFFFFFLRRRHSHNWTFVALFKRSILNWMPAHTNERRKEKST